MSGLTVHTAAARKAALACFCSLPRERRRESVCVSVCVCAPPIIMIAWEACFGTLLLACPCKCSHLT